MSPPPHARTPFSRRLTRPSCAHAPPRAPVLYACMVYVYVCMHAFMIYNLCLCLSLSLSLSLSVFLSLSLSLSFSLFLSQRQHYLHCPLVVGKGRNLVLRIHRSHRLQEPAVIQSGHIILFREQLCMHTNITITIHIDTKRTHTHIQRIETLALSSTCVHLKLFKIKMHIFRVIFMCVCSVGTMQVPGRWSRHSRQSSALSFLQK